MTKKALQLYESIAPRSESMTLISIDIGAAEAAFVNSKFYVEEDFR